MKNGNCIRLLWRIWYSQGRKRQFLVLLVRVLFRALLTRQNMNVAIRSLLLSTEKNHIRDKDLG